MPVIKLGDESHTVFDGETVLDTLERVGRAPASSCRGGQCQTCMMRVVEGDVPDAAQAGLKASWKAAGAFLPCVTRPSTDLSLTSLDEILPTVRATLREREIASQGVAILRLSIPDAATPMRAGQFMHVYSADGQVARPYSIASATSSDTVELHVREIPGGVLSPYLCGALEVGGEVTVRGPQGECVYLDDDGLRPLLLSGVSTGLAPLLGVLRDALDAGHKGPIHLLHGARTSEGLYAQEALAEISESAPNVTVSLVALEGETPPGVSQGELAPAVIDAVKTLGPKATRAYLCGDPAFVTPMKKALFLAGMALREIYSDPFTPSASPSSAAP